eukprot:1458001-Amphidinium_carterae.1
MLWVKSKWKTGIVEFTGPLDPQAIRFLGLNLEVVRKQQGDMPPGSVTINQIEYCVDTLAKFDETFNLKGRTSPGDHDSFRQSETLPDAAIREYEKAKEKGLNVAGVAGTLNWLALRSRPDIAWS